MDAVQTMYDYFVSRPCYDFYGTHQSFDLNTPPHGVKLGRHSIKDNLACPGLIDVITNEKLIKTASNFLNAPATLSLVLPMWSFPYQSKAPINMQLFHRDADDYKFVKFFMYLSDVEQGEGEQVYIQGTNEDPSLPPSLYAINRYPDADIESALPDREKKVIVGKAGTSWFADTYGIHRGTVPSTKKRLLLQLQFSYNPVPIFNYRSYRFKRWDNLSDLVKYSTRLYLKRFE